MLEPDEKECEKGGMKTVYRYIRFEQDEDEPDPKRWFCENKQLGERLGTVEQYAPWRQWVIAFDPTYVFDSSCLDDISHFLAQLNKPDKAET